MECPPFANSLQISINTHKPVPGLFAFGPIGDAMTDIPFPVRLYRKMCMVTVKRRKAFQHVMLYMNMHFFLSEVK
jgi:hypothetical protein